MNIFCYVLNFLDNILMAIRNTINTMVLDELMDSLISKEVRWKSFESTNECLFFHGRLKGKGNTRLKGKYKSHGRVNK
jgi:hypothetical protein